LPIRKIVWLASLMLVVPAAGRAQTLPPLSLPLGDSQVQLAGEAGGALFEPHQPGQRDTAASGDLRLMPQLRRDYDNGMSLALGGTLAAADPLSYGRYDGDVIERLAGSIRTGLGLMEIGITDGAGYQLAVSGPKADPGVSLEDPRTSFYRDPVSHHALIDMFALRTEVGASSNYAKLAYSSPSLFGLQLAMSFTPSQAKQLPFLNAGPHLSDRQADIWEAALRYEIDLGPASLTVGGAFAEGRGEHKLAGQEGTSDLGLGLRADYPVTEEIGLSLGGAYRQSNAYGFDIDQSWQAATTHADYVSAAVTGWQWTANLEFGNGLAGAAGGQPGLGLNGLQASLGYAISDSFGVSSGWQHLTYTRTSGLFFDGAPQLKLDAVYLHINMKTSEQ
jgi:Gram-negative porin